MPLSIALLLAATSTGSPARPRPAPGRCKWCGAGMPHDFADCAICGRPREGLAGEVFYTVPWDPDAEGAHVRGVVIHGIQLAAKFASEGGWSAEELQARPQWHEMSLRGALVRQAVKWGLIP